MPLMDEGPSTGEGTGERGVLEVVATPIGNLGDVSARAKDALSQADLLLCEDTRVTRRLLSALAVSAPELWRCDAHREDDQAPAVVERVASGQRVVLVSDAGTPALSDPGGRIVAAVHDAGLPVRCVPGPSSLVAALSVSGLPAAPLHFVGFPPRKAGPRDRWLRQCLSWPGTVVMLEAGRRTGDLVAALAALVPDRDAAICRELSKRHEEVLRGRLAELPTDPVRGEVVVVVGPGSPPASQDGAPADLGSLKAVAAVLAERWGVSRRAAYQRLLALDDELGRTD